MEAWGITDGSAGMRSQVQGVLQTLGLPYALKTVRRRKPWVWLPGWFHCSALHQVAAGSDTLAPPWPKLVITSGRRSAAFALAIKKASGGKTKIVHLTDPRISPKHFDLVVAMGHDATKGPNVIHTRFALHRVTPQALAEAAGEWRARFDASPRPWVGVLLGGTTPQYRLTAKAAAEVAARLKALHESAGGSLLATSSRRTGRRNTRILAQALEGSGLFYRGEGENPYMGILALADYLVVTDDSVNMLSEAVASAKPLYLLRLPGHENTRPARFAEALVVDGLARWLNDAPLTAWHYEAPDEMPAVIEAIGALL